MSIQLTDISKSYVTHTLFEGLTLQIGTKSRVGLIGRNGCGKSTLLKIILGYTEPNSGSRYVAPGLQINYLSQEPRITPGNTLETEMRSVFTELNALYEEEIRLVKSLESEGHSQERQLQMAQRLSVIHSEMERLDARSVDARIGRILKGLGFSLADHQRKTAEFSGGWKMRINLAKVLLEGADVLLLDEPTNHLDLEACEWLESFLGEYPGGLMIVSHDRRFLDRVATEIADLESGRLKVWTGNYTAHLGQKAAELELLTSAYDRQQKEITKQSAFVERFRASANRSTQAKSREKQLEKIERIELPQQDKRRMSFQFPSPKPSGHQVLTLRNVRKAFGDKLLFDKLNADLQRHQRIFLLGANGTGKTTLLRLILGQEALDAGEIRPGHNTNIGYFSQNQLDTLEPQATVFESLQAACPQLTNTELRTLLGCFLFTGEQVFKPVSVLSGGEKSKVALAKLMVSGPNTLLLDEPTNHMDIPAKEVMTQALLSYEGSMVCISHDRYFIQELATDIWEIYNGKLLTYCGDYDYYLSKRDEMRRRFAPELAPISLAKAEAPKSDGVKSAEPPKTEVHKSAGELTFNERRELEKRLKKVEKGIMAAEMEVATLETQLNDPALQQDYQQLQAVSEAIQRQQATLSHLNDEWAELAEQLS